MRPHRSDETRCLHSQSPALDDLIANLVGSDASRNSFQCTALETERFGTLDGELGAGERMLGT